MRRTVQILICALFLASEAEAQGAEGYVQQRFLHGVPYTQSRLWSTDQDVARLVQMLDEDIEQEHWTNIVAVLGIIGDDAAFCPLLEFLSRPGREARAEEALITVPLALGYLVHSKRDLPPGGHSRAGEALAILSRGVDPEFWAGLGPAESTSGCRPWTPIAATDDQGRYIRQMLARRSVLGLVLSGHADAEVALDGLIRTMGRDEELRALHDDLLPGLMKSARLIRTKGLAKYYGE